AGAAQEACRAVQEAWEAAPLQAGDAPGGDAKNRQACAGRGPSGAGGERAGPLRHLAAVAGVQAAEGAPEGGFEGGPHYQDGRAASAERSLPCSRSNHQSLPRLFRAQNPGPGAGRRRRRGAQDSVRGFR
ncbi:unnamed protein product, partial [Symbiodinium natans]